MIVQLLSDLHLETERFDPEPAPGAEVLVLGGDIDSGWAAYERFADWPVPVLAVAGNHEFDGRELDHAWPALHAHCARLGITLLERQAVVLTGADGRRVRFVGSVRWSDFDAFGPARRDKAMRAAGYFLHLMAGTRGGAPLDAGAVRAEALACRDWLATALAEPAAGRWDATVCITHFAPSLRSADPRYGHQAGTASFCNDDDELLALADLWLHGHLHCRHDYPVAGAGQARGRVVCQSRGMANKGEDLGFDPWTLFPV